MHVESSYVDYHTICFTSFLHRYANIRKINLCCQFLLYVIDFNFIDMFWFHFYHVYVLNTSFPSETWRDHCSSWWGLVCREFKSFLYSKFPFFRYNCQKYPQNSLVVVLTPLVAHFCQYVPEINIWNLRRKAISDF